VVLVAEPVEPIHLAIDNPRMPKPWRPQSVQVAYAELLDSVWGAAGAIGPGRLTSHWPLVGTAPERLLVVGQAVFGWIPDWRVADLGTPSGRAAILRETQLACYELADPMSWIEEHRVRSSPFWRMVRRTVEALWPDSSLKWFSHVAWTNLYPIAPNDVKGNPSGALLEAQTVPAARLLQAVADELDPVAVLVLGGPYWWPFQEHFPLTVLNRAERPLLAQGTVNGRSWVAGMHPAGAQRYGWRVDDYARIVALRLR